MKLLKDFLRIVYRAASYSFEKYRYQSPDGYNAKRYWTDRLSKFGQNLRGVGNRWSSEIENEQMYHRAKKEFLALCRQEGIDFENARILDIGCGTGFYADVFRENGGRNYLGIDITDVLFEKLRKGYPGFEFRLIDITEQELDGEYDLIVMIDVTQHITNEAKFSFAMKNVRSLLSEQGVFVVTSWLSKKPRYRFYEVFRTMNDYKREFFDYSISNPTPFRDKYIFSIRKNR